MRAEKIAALGEIPGDRIGLVGHLCLKEVSGFRFQVSGFNLRLET
jgi:hypothetical protein